MAALAVLLVLVLVLRMQLGGQTPAGQTMSQAISPTMAPAPSPSPTPSPTPTPLPTPEPTPADLSVPGQSQWQLQIANTEYLLAEDFAPEELAYIESGQSVDARIEEPLRALFAAAREAGYTLYFCSGYRDYDTQSIIYWRHIDDFMAQGMTFEEADAETRLSVMPPGASEHQLGLTADVLEYAEQDMLPYIGGSGLMLWLEENCADYGFIIRYPEDKIHITGVSYEPWHLRYVGIETAKYIMQEGLCLEEYLQEYMQADQTTP